MMKGWLSRLKVKSLNPPAMMVLGLLCFAILAGLGLWKVPESQVPSNLKGTKDGALLENEFRKTTAQIVVGAFVLIGATATGIGVYYTARRVRATERTVEVAQEQQITERFTRAIDQLGNEQSMAIRLGGIYALERIAKDSAKDHWQVMEVLTAYVRENARWHFGNSLSLVPIPEEHDQYSVPTDIQAILTVLGRREVRTETDEDVLDLQFTDLRGADFSKADLRKSILSHSCLEGANLAQACLRGANFQYSNLVGCSLFGANLQGAGLTSANLTSADLRSANLNATLLSFARLHGARLTDAKLQEAELLGADLSGTDLIRANLQGALFTDTNLQQADLSGTDLSDTRNLTQEQIDSAITDETTILPDYLKREE